MTTFVLLAFFLAPAAAAAAGKQERAAVTPVQKVIQLMEGMVAKGKKEKQQEQVQFAAYKTFCDTTNGQKQKAIKEGNEQMLVLKANIEDAESEAADLTEEIAQHDEDIATWNGDLKASTKVREIENEGYLLAHKDYTESIQAIEDGIAELKGQAHDVEQVAPTLVQKHSSLKRISSMYVIPVETKQALDAFLSPEDEKTR